MADVDDVADELGVAWTEENIPDEDVLFYRVHCNDMDGEKPKPGAFRNHPRGDPNSGMSTNWSKYCSAEQTRQNAPQSPQNYAVVQLGVGKVREIPGQTVKHTPNIALNNRSHTDVFGEKNTEVRLKFMERYTLLLRVDGLPSTT
jgi:hypothetical protein